MKTGKLFEIIKENLDSGASYKATIDAIKSDPELIKASNSYCMQCGNCCKRRCANKEEKEGLVYCLLHDDSKGQKRAENIEIRHKLDPKEYTKPITCHTYGPHLVFPAIKYYKEQKNWGMVQETKIICPGAVKMLKDYEHFLQSHEKRILEKTAQ